ncbi:hypothetical protein [Aphanizomenon flos-aquae]|uniref:hypothetical protein n=1 Tax=Aphanizomenon flos-aquae TaxID=1176 RepID=UPI000ABCC676|nr:hypothetical protein [Aphanizomenon flos-aquae]
MKVIKYVGYPPEINTTVTGITKTITQWIAENAIAFGTNTVLSRDTCKNLQDGLEMPTVSSFQQFLPPSL